MIDVLGCYSSKVLLRCCQGVSGRDFVILAMGDNSLLSGLEITKHFWLLSMSFQASDLNIWCMTDRLYSLHFWLLKTKVFSRWGNIH